MSFPALPSGFRLQALTLDRAQARAGLDAFKDLLDTARMDEQEHILPLFRQHAHLGALLSRVYFIDPAQSQLAMRLELNVGFFRADLVVADLHRNHYLLVEFEHGHHDSIFARGQRSTPEWSKTFEHGYSQIVDWFWWLARNEGSGEYHRLFLRETPTITGLLVIGRDLPTYEAELRERLAWRMEYSVINSRKIYVSTYDELFRALDSNWRAL